MLEAGPEPVPLVLGGNNLGRETETKDEPQGDVVRRDGVTGFDPSEGGPDAWKEFCERSVVSAPINRELTDCVAKYFGTGGSDGSVRVGPDEASPACSAGLMGATSTGGYLSTGVSEVDIRAGSEESDPTCSVGSVRTVNVDEEVDAHAVCIERGRNAVESEREAKVLCEFQDRQYDRHLGLVDEPPGGVLFDPDAGAPAIKESMARYLNRKRDGDVGNEVEAKPGFVKLKPFGAMSNHAGSDKGMARPSGNTHTGERSKSRRAPGCNRTRRRRVARGAGPEHATNTTRVESHDEGIAGKRDIGVKAVVPRRCTLAGRDAGGIEKTRRADTEAGPGSASKRDVGVKTGLSRRRARVSDSVSNVEESFIFDDIFGGSGVVPTPKIVEGSGSGHKAEATEKRSAERPEYRPKGGINAQPRRLRSKPEGVEPYRLRAERIWIDPKPCSGGETSKSRSSDKHIANQSPRAAPVVSKKKKKRHKKKKGKAATCSLLAKHQVRYRQVDGKQYYKRRPRAKSEYLSAIYARRDDGEMQPPATQMGGIVRSGSCDSDVISNSEIGNSTDQPRAERGWHMLPEKGVARVANSEKGSLTSGAQRLLNYVAGQRGDGASGGTRRGLVSQSYTETITTYHKSKVDGRSLACKGSAGSPESGAHGKKKAVNTGNVHCRGKNSKCAPDEGQRGASAVRTAGAHKGELASDAGIVRCGNEPSDQRKVNDVSSRVANTHTDGNRGYTIYTSSKSIHKGRMVTVTLRYLDCMQASGQGKTLKEAMMVSIAAIECGFGIN